MATGNTQYLLGPDPTSGNNFAAMPLRRVHLISGASGKGKTTLLFQMLKAQHEGKDFLGYKTQWHPSVYVAFDRMVEEQEETMERVGISPDVIPHYYWIVPMVPGFNDKDDRLEKMVRDIVNLHPEMKVLYIDAMYILADHGRINDYCVMSAWLQRATILCDKMDITIVGVVHTAKQKKGQEILDARYSTIGSVASGGFTSTQIVVEQPDPQDDDHRRVYVYPRQTKQQTFELVVDDNGLLVPDDVDEDNKAYALERYLTSDLAGQAAQFGDIVKYMQSKLGVSRMTCKRYLDQLLATGRIEKIGRGVYCAKKGVTANGQEA